MIAKETLKSLLRSDLEYHEGCKYEIYRCTAGFKTFGIGHKVTFKDREITYNVGDPIPQERVDEVFDDDLEIALSDAEDFLESFWEQPQYVQRVLVNLSFNLGRPRLFKFQKFHEALELKDYQKAAMELKDSRWYNQVGRRAKDLVVFIRTGDCPWQV